MPPPRRSYRPLPATEAPVAEADALISLPRDVLDDILNRVGPRDAVRTSALSRAWRYRWEAVAPIDLDFDDDPRYVGAVDSILLRCPGRVRLFRANLDDDEPHPHEGRIHDWLLVLSRRDVAILDISGSLNLHSSVFTCRRLTSLRLQYCGIPLLPPGFQGWPVLRELTLDRVELDENGQYQLEEIIAKSPLLEELALFHVEIPGELKEWVIQAHNLWFLNISSPRDNGWDLGELPRLNSAVIDIYDYLGDRDFSTFLSSLTRITELDISTYYQPLNWANKLETLRCTFVNLKSLTLRTNLCGRSTILSTFCLLRNAPSLESLKIQVYYCRMEQQFEANGEFQNAQCTDGMCANLQFVTMIGIRWFSNEMSFIELILSKARLLCTLSISVRLYGVLLMSNDGALKKLLNYKKASTHAEVIFKGRSHWY